LAGVSAGDTWLDVHARLAADFNRRLAAQVQNPAKRAGEEASRHFGRKFAAGLAIGGAAIGVGLAKATRAAVRGIRETTDRASDLNETVNKTNVIFGRSAAEIQKWSRGSARSMGLPRQEALANASAFGDMFLQLKLGRPRAVDMSKSMVALASDLASFHNADITQVLEAQQSAFRGEYDALQRFIPNINAARVEQEALRLSHKKSAKDLTAAEKAQAAYNIMLRDSVSAQGDFQRTSRDLANTRRIERAQWADLQAAIGKLFLPAQLAWHQAMSQKIIPALGLLVDRYGPTVERTVTRWAQGFTGLIPSTKDLGLGLNALQAAFSGEGVTTSSTKFVGKMERLGVAARKVVDIGRELRLAVHLIAAGFREGDVTSSGWHGTLERLGGTARRFVDDLRQTGPQLREAASGGQVFADTLTITGPILDVVARNIHKIVPWLPALVAGFLAFRAVRTVLGPVRDIGQAIANFSSPAMAAATFLNAKASRALAAAMREQAAASLQAAGAQQTSNTAGKVGLATSIRARAAAIGQAVAQRAIAVASRAWAAAQWLVNVALTANPIGLVIAAVALLVAGIVIAYKKSETFRTIVGKVWDFVRDKVGAVVSFIISAVRGWLNVQLSVVQGILHVMGKLPGPMGAPFRKAEEAVKKAKETVNRKLDEIQARVNRLRGKDIPISASLKLNFTKSFTQKDWVQVRLAAGRMAVGGPVIGRGPRGKDSELRWLAPGEHVWTDAEVVAAGGHRAMERWRKGVLAGQVPELAAGGPVGRIDTQTRAINRLQARGTARRMDAGLTKLLSMFPASIPHTAGSWKLATDYLRRIGMAFSIISTFRPGARTHASGSVSYHALNRAVDIAGPNMLAIFEALTRTNPTELIYSGADRYKSRRGWRPIGALDPITLADHWSHVHAAYHRGGRLPEDIVGVGRSGRTYAFQGGEGLVPRESAGLHVTVNLNGPVLGSARQVARELAPELREQLRQLGHQKGIKVGL
jgi:hypothetical protein